MARPEKQGITYFSFDVDFFSDIKIKKIMRACGPKSIPVLVNLLCNIYRDKGYYIEWDDEIGFLVADEVGANESIAEEVVNKCLQVGFFDKDIFEKYKILTSKGIQERYLKATYQRKNNDINPDLLMIKNEKPSYSHEKPMNNPVNHTESTQSKVKESKVDKSKEKESSSDNSELAKLKDFYVQNFGMMSPLTYDDLQHSLTDYGFDLSMEAMIRAVRQQKTFSGALKILKYWERNRIKTLEDAMAESAAFERKKTGYSAKTNSNVKSTKGLPEWGDEYKLIKAGVDTTEMTQNQMYKLAGEMGFHNG